ncbi:hypothetical protein [Dapis sp. BLCC M229]|uniref:hypothetical protein n=1 Tax=Dapis sp. BLCC M229 TaxID=3400188 RepID=UPI003CF3B3C4
MKYTSKQIIVTNSYEQQILEEKIYNHFLKLVSIESIEQMIERFRILFFQSSSYQTPEISTALERILQFPECEEQFNYILNRCCYILINYQQQHQDQKNVLEKLIQLFSQATSKSDYSYYGYCQTKKILELVRGFTHSQQYLSLKRLAALMNQGFESKSRSSLNQPLKIIIPRYPYLYNYLLLTPKSSTEYQQAIRKLQEQKQQKFEINLSRYITNQARIELCQFQQLQSVKQLQSIKNPTLLSNNELLLSIKQFVGKVEGRETYQDYAKRFLTYIKIPQPYHSFKDSFYEYLSTSFDVESQQIRVRFKEQLYKHLQNVMSENDNQLFNEFLMKKTCSKMLSFLIVNNQKQLQHYLFVNLIDNLGPIITTGLLLKILLVCQEVRPGLEQRFAILFNHYESSTQKKVQWLVKALENMQIALSTNFGRIDLSFIH